MIATDRKKLADRILKLLALASSTTFGEEAATARRMAADLMAAHNIEAVPGKPSQDSFDRRHYSPFAKGMKWEFVILNALAKLCGCAIYFDEPLHGYALAGSIGNLNTLEYMIEETKRQRIRAWLDHKATGNPDSFNKFCFGYAQALKDKIDKLIDAAAVHKNRAALELWYETTVLGRPVNHRQIKTGKATSAAGLDAGRKASLHAGTVGGGGGAARQIAPPKP